MIIETYRSLIELASAIKSGDKHQIDDAMTAMICTVARLQDHVKSFTERQPAQAQGPQPAQGDGFDSMTDAEQIALLHEIWGAE